VSHTVIIVQQAILPPPDAQAASSDHGSMTAEIRYTPPHDATPPQIGNQVERIVKRLARLADSDPPKALAGE
jgi:hypothetical protein